MNPEYLTIFKTLITTLTTDCTIHFGLVLVASFNRVSVLGELPHPVLMSALYFLSILIRSTRLSTNRFAPALTNWALASASLSLIRFLLNLSFVSGNLWAAHHASVTSLVEMHRMLSTNIIEMITNMSSIEIILVQIVSFSHKSDPSIIMNWKKGTSICVRGNELHQDDFDGGRFPHRGNCNNTELRARRREIREFINWGKKGPWNVRRHQH